MQEGIIGRGPPLPILRLAAQVGVGGLPSVAANAFGKLRK